MNDVAAIYIKRYIHCCLHAVLCLFKQKLNTCVLNCSYWWSQKCEQISYFDDYYHYCSLLTYNCNFHNPKRHLLIEPLPTFFCIYTVYVKCGTIDFTTVFRVCTAGYAVQCLHQTFINPSCTCFCYNSYHKEFYYKTQTLPQVTKPLHVNMPFGVHMLCLLHLL